MQQECRTSQPGGQRRPAEPEQCTRCDVFRDAGPARTAVVCSRIGQRRHLHEVKVVEKFESIYCSKVLYCSDFWLSIDNTKFNPDIVKEFFVDSYAVSLIKDKLPNEYVSNVEYKFACISSSYALESLLAIHQAGMNKAPYSLLICTDIAKYDLESPGEYTQGAAAVAILISNEARLLEINTKTNINAG